MTRQLKYAVDRQSQVGIHRNDAVKISTIMAERAPRLVMHVFDAGPFAGRQLQMLQCLSPAALHRLAP